MEQVDVIIIGSGQGGVPLAADLASEGQRVVLFERDRLGGSCVNYGCHPSKLFLASAHAAARARRAARLGVHAEVRVDFPAVMQRVRRVRDQMSSGVARRLERAGVRVVRAEARFTGERTVEGGGVTVTAPLVIINTGTSPAVPPIPGLENTPYLTNLTFFELTELPARTLVLGGGYVGLELGQGLAQLGSEVHVIEMAERILPTEEPEVSETLQSALEADGVRFHLGARAERVAHENGRFTVALSNGQVLEGEALLVATGRRPNTPALNAPAAGIELDARGFIKVDDRFRTTAEGVYAIGDVTGQPAFTHVSWEDYRRLMAVLRGEDRHRGDRVLGYVAFTEPQLGRAGLTLEQAQSQGYKARAATLPMKHVARAIDLDETQGFFRLVIDEETERILGATFVGYEAGELVQLIMVLMEAKASWRVLEQSQLIHPTLAEGLPVLARKFTQ